MRPIALQGMHERRHERETTMGHASRIDPTASAPSRRHEAGEPHRFKLMREGSIIPASLWAPKAAARGLVLVCHGGSGHKESGAVLALVDALRPLNLAVASIDGPVHGERRADGNLDPSVARQSFRDAWRAGVGFTSMGEDFSALLDHLQADPAWASLPVGYIGVSMGTAYGLPFLARERRVLAAAIGLWSTTYPASSALIDHARKVRCAVWFTQQWNDEFFDRAGTAELFDMIGAADKRLVAYPGPHRELEGERLEDAVAFIARKLLSSQARS